MTVSPPPAVILSDVFCCLGLGLLLALTLDVLSLLLPGSVGRFLLDVLGFALAAVLLYSFAAGRSGAGVPRWFHGAGLLAGILACHTTLTPALIRLREALLRPFKAEGKQLKIRMGRGKKRKPQKLSKKVSPKPEKQLPKKGRMLYNSYGNTE